MSLKVSSKSFSQLRVIGSPKFMIWTYPIFASLVDYYHLRYKRSWGCYIICPRLGYFTFDRFTIEPPRPINQRYELHPNNWVFLSSLWTTQWTLSIFSRTISWFGHTSAFMIELDLAVPSIQFAPWKDEFLSSHTQG